MPITIINHNTTMTALTPHARAAELAGNMLAVIPYLRALAVRSYDIANTPGQQQAIMDALPDFGISATQALGTYATIHASLAALGQADGLTAPNMEVFVPQPDGTVLYVAPPEPEEQPTTPTEGAIPPAPNQDASESLV